MYFQKAEEAERRTGNENSYFSRKRQKNDVRNDVHVQMYVYVLYELRKRKMCARCFGLNFAFGWKGFDLTVFFQGVKNQ